MRVADFRVRNFRNHPNTRIEPGSGVNLLWGKNGQGKTNILEAVSCLSLTKSFYAANDGTMLRLGESRMEIDGVLVSDSGLAHNVCMVYDGTTGTKEFTINNSKPETLSSVIGRFPLVVLSPENNAITFGGPAARRKFLDILLSQLSRTYFEDLLSYRRALKQRNRTLVDARRAGRIDREALEPWTIGVAKFGSRIIHRRALFLAEFAEFLVKAYRDLVEPVEIPRLDYHTQVDAGGHASEEEVERDILNALERNQKEELARGLTLVGPHRDDLELLLNEISVQKYASQGQHKTFLIALKIAEFFYLAERVSETPLFLLDDVFSELDQIRSEQIVGLLQSLGQTMITATDPRVFGSALEWNAKHRRFTVDQGTCRPS